MRLVVVVRFNPRVHEERDQVVVLASDGSVCFNPRVHEERDFRAPLVINSDS